ncbi:MFS transporter [Microbacterium hydrocarbonoxydans]|uniref:MFS transporter n=1 Tax=Microbacterium hydrocarbonoxydans TaxID=273678 RepID=UPI0020C8D0D1|nr:MFS transporter [Microbacterium hydrocarbonoxydans]
MLGAQYAVTAGLFFMVPVYLQMTLGFDALETGIRIFPLSVALILFSIVGTALSRKWSPRRIVRVGQGILVLSAILLLGAVTEDLRSVLFGSACSSPAAPSPSGLPARQREHVEREGEGHE